MQQIDFLFFLVVNILIYIICHETVIDKMH